MSKIGQQIISKAGLMRGGRSPPAFRSKAWSPTLRGQTDVVKKLCLIFQAYCLSLEP